ncbi:MAG: hypothetical protein OEM52_00430 [bacterium]|nr:hypothetical protein [bacterium]
MQSNFSQLIAVAVLATILVSGCDESTPITPNPNAGPTATEIFTNQPLSRWHEIAGLNTALPDTDTSPGFLAMLNTGLLAARRTAYQLDNYTLNDTVGFVYTDGWYTRTSDTLYGGSIAVRWKYTPNPFRLPGGVPDVIDQELRLSYTDTFDVTTTTVATVLNNVRSGMYHNGSMNVQYQLQVSVLGFPARTITYGAPLTWSFLDNRKTGSNYSSPRGDYSAIGTSELSRDSTTGESTTYNFEGQWSVSGSATANDSIGYLRVGGELFCSYFFTNFDVVTGTYRGKYRFAQGSDSLFSFQMVGL